MIRLIITLLTVMVLLISCSSQPPNETQKLDEYFATKSVKAKIIGMQVASIGDGELVWQGSYGVKENMTDKAVNDSTLFMMASCSKPVTSLGIMKLYDQGRFDLDDDINEYLPFKINNPNYPREVIHHWSFSIL